MASNTKIEWCDATWNPVVGCSKVSAGCANCYAVDMAARFCKHGQPFHGTVVTAEQIRLERYMEGHIQREPTRSKWTGLTVFKPHKLEQPLHWRKPRKIFVCSMGDLFHDSITNEQIAAIFGVMASCPQHTFIVLTKRPQRALEWFEWFLRVGCGDLHRRLQVREDFTVIWPLQNVWLGVSIEDQQTAEERIPILLQIPAAKRFVSAEPLLGEVDLTDLVTIDGDWEDHRDSLFCDVDPEDDSGPGGWNGACLDWVICGSETGPGKRRMNLNWARSLRDQCAEAGVPFFFKKDSNGNRELDGVLHEEWPK